jgi:hypothetical protein
MYYINEPLVQKLDPFTQFMGGMTGFVRSVNSLRKLTDAPKHWSGTKIEVTKRGSFYPDDVQVSVYQDEMLVHCNHANQEIEPVSFNTGLDDEYTVQASVCQKCGAGWDKSGEQIMEGNL